MGLCPELMEDMQNFKEKNRLNRLVIVSLGAEAPRLHQTGSGAQKSGSF